MGRPLKRNVLVNQMSGESVFEAVAVLVVVVEGGGEVMYSRGLTTMLYGCPLDTNLTGGLITLGLLYGWLKL